MKHETTPIDPQNFTAERVLSDAELLKGGAEIVDGHLHAAASQVIEIAQQHEHDEKMGSLALEPSIRLHTPGDELDKKSVDDLVEENEKTTSLMTEVRDLVRPYTIAFNEKVPAPSEADRNWRGKLKSERDVEPWSTQIQFDRAAVRYDFDASYTPGEGHNDLSHVEMGIHNIGEKSKRTPGIRLALDYQNDQLRKLSVDLSKQETEVMQIRSLLGHDEQALTNFLWFDTRMAAPYLEGGRFSIEFGDSTITMTGESDAYKTPFIYEFRPEADAFMQTNPQGFDIRYTDSKGFKTQGRYEERIPREKFVGMIREILSLIPTTRG